MHLSVWLIIGIILMIPWLVAMVLQMDPANKLDPLSPKSIFFWFLILGIIVFSIGIGFSFTGRHGY